MLRSNNRERPAFTLTDFVGQVQQVRRLGAMGKILSMVPCMRDVIGQIRTSKQGLERQLAGIVAMHCSMTPAERLDTDLLHRSRSRRTRIARGAGVDFEDVSALIRQFEITLAIMRQV